MNIPDNVQSEINAGRIWRAKEILLSQVAGEPFDPKKYERLGQVLLRTGDMFHAGKFLFLSGMKDPNYEAAIDIFIDRHRKAGWRGLVATWPGKAKATKFSDLPDSVKEALKELGFPEGGENGIVKTWPQYKRTFKDRLLNACLAVGCGLFLLFLLASVAAGIPVVFRTVGGLLS